MNQPIRPQSVSEEDVMLRPEEGLFPLIQEKMVGASSSPEAAMKPTEAAFQAVPPNLNLWAEFLDALQRTFRVKPWVTLSSLWVILLVLGWMATAEIISPGNDQPKPRTPVAEAQREQSSSLGVLGAIGFSCATISIVLAQKFGQDRRR
jgi:hypothetical protein